MKQYQDLLREILAHGTAHQDRTGVGTISRFGHQMRFDLREGFPIVTTKRVPFRWVAEELFWFLSGSTDERDLSARGVDIWEEWATAEQTARFGRSEGDLRSEERRVGKECRSRWTAYHEKKKAAEKFTKEHGLSGKVHECQEVEPELSNSAAAANTKLSSVEPVKKLKLRKRLLRLGAGALTP